jgi:hypothetical protein
MVNSEELIGITVISDTTDEVSYKPMSFYPGSTVFTSSFANFHFNFFNNLLTHSCSYLFIYLFIEP